LEEEESSDQNAAGYVFIFIISNNTLNTKITKGKPETVLQGETNTKQKYNYPQLKVEKQAT
jgi:hypothetical protein